MGMQCRRNSIKNPKPQTDLKNAKYTVKQKDQHGDPSGTSRRVLSNHRVL